MEDRRIPLPASLDPYRKEIEASVKPFIRIHAALNEAVGIGQSRFGGLPDLSASVDYPTDATGKPMVFVAQINAAELPPLLFFPQRGLLQFYVADDAMYGLSLENDVAENAGQDKPAGPQNFKVLYVEDNPENCLTDFSFLPAFTHHPVTQTYALHFALETAPVGTEDIDFEQTFGMSSYRFFGKQGEQSEKAKAYYTRTFSACGHKMGGYAHFTQEDPRWMWEDFTQAILLLQIDSDSQGIRWGDKGIAHFFILPKDLQKLDFSNVRYHWDAP